MPDLLALGELQDAAVGGACEYDPRMRAVRIRKCRHDVRGFAVSRPFAVIKRVARRSLDGLYQFPAAVGDEDAFVRGVLLPSKLAAGFPAEVEERGSLAAILRERCVAGLRAVVPDGVAGIFCER